MAKKRKNGVKIEKKSVPLRSQYPFSTLEVDQSFIEDDLGKAGSLRASASRAGKKLGRTFRVVTEHITGEKPVLRCGRVA